MHSHRFHRSLSSGSSAFLLSFLCLLLLSALRPFSPAALPSPASGNVTFTVTAPDGAPVAGALVTLAGSGSSATTGADGAASFKIALPRDCEFTITKPGYFDSLKKFHANQPQALIALTLKKFTPWSSFVINNFESRNPAANRVKFHPEEPAIKRDIAGWFLNCLGEHEGTVRTYDANNHASSTKGDFLTCEFEGASIRVFTLRSRNSGKARISIDGAAAKIVDLYANTDTNSDYALAYENHNLSPGKHTIKLEVLGEKNASATGTKVYFDFLDTSTQPVFPRFQIGGRASASATLPTAAATTSTATTDAKSLATAGSAGFPPGTTARSAAQAAKKNLGAPRDAPATDDEPCACEGAPARSGAGVIANTTREVAFAHSLVAAGPGGFASIEEAGFVIAPQTGGRAPTINDIRLTAKLDANNKFCASAPAGIFDKHTKYVVLSYAVVDGVVYYCDEPAFFTPVSKIVLERNIVGIQAGQGAISTREITLRDTGGIRDLKWKLLRQNTYDGAPATGIISRDFADGDAARKDAPQQITGLSEGEAVIRCYSASNPEDYADCVVIVAKAERNPRLAARPVMGWSTWNYYGRAITREAMYEAIDNMTKPLPCAGGKSLKDLGYTYFQVDGGWRKNWLAPDGRITPTGNFGGVQGMKALSDHVHAKGMKFGLHMCPGWGDCAGQPMGSDGFEKLHLRGYVDWGLDYLFVDSCTTEAGRRQDPDQQYIQTLYTKFKYYLDNCGRDMVFVATGLNRGEWGHRLVNAWRVSGDISTRINTSHEGQGRWLDPLDRAKPKNAAAFTGAKSAARQWQKVGQGKRVWPHADAMALGDPGLSLVEQQSMFNLWCITASLLMLGGDLNKITDEKEGIVQIVTNEELIAINQDPLGRAGHVLKSYTNHTGKNSAKSSEKKSAGKKTKSAPAAVAQTAKSAKGRANPPGEPPHVTAQPEASPYLDSSAALEQSDHNLVVFGRPLHDGSWALVIMNNTRQVQNITVRFADLDYDGAVGGKTKLAAGKYFLRNLNTRQDMGWFTNEFTYKNIPVHGSVMIKVTPEKPHR